MTDEQFNSLSEGEKNVCSLCADWNLGDCRYCELERKVKEDKNVMRKRGEERCI